jgi:hypothetical protein
MAVDGSVSEPMPDELEARDVAPSYSENSEVDVREAVHSPPGIVAPFVAAIWYVRFGFDCPITEPISVVGAELAFRFIQNRSLTALLTIDRANQLPEGGCA